MMGLSAAEVANSAKKNCGTTVPVKIRSFAKNMDDTSMYMFCTDYVCLFVLFCDNVSVDLSVNDLMQKLSDIYFGAFAACSQIVLWSKAI